MMMLVRPEATASSITYWMIGLSTRGSISLGCAFVAGRNRVPSPAAGNTALRIFRRGVDVDVIEAMLPQGSWRPHDERPCYPRPRAGPPFRRREQGARPL